MQNENEIFEERIKKIRMTDLIQYSAILSNETFEDIVSQCRLQTLVRVRFAIIKIGREMGYTYPHIAKYLGNRDHTTIIHGFRQCNNLILYDDDFREFFDKLKSCIINHSPQQLGNLKNNIQIEDSHCVASKKKERIYIWDDELEEIFVK